MVKKLTVNGIIGKIQGVSRARSPLKIPNKKTKEKTSKVSIVKPKKIYKSKIVKIKKNRTYKVLRLRQSLEKNDIISLDDIELLEVSNSSQKSFFGSKQNR